MPLANLPEEGRFELTQEILAQVNAKIFYDLSLVGRMADHFGTEFPVEYELEIYNSTNESASRVEARGVQLDITTNQPGVTIKINQKTPLCVGPVASLNDEFQLRCIFSPVGIVPPILVNIIGAQPGNLEVSNTLTVLGNPEQETNKENNTLTLTTTVSEATSTTYRTADIYPIGAPDRKVDSEDYKLLSDNFNKRSSDEDWVSAADIVQDGWIDLEDYAELIRQFSPAGY